MKWKDKIKVHSRILEEISFSNKDGKVLNCDDGFAKLKSMISEVKKDRKTVYAVGNGASASMASHFSADLAKNGHLHTQVFSDLSLITAISNDIGYEEVFAEPLRRRSASGDMLVAISSSGNSPNVLRAVDVASEKGLRIVSISAMNPSNRLRTVGDINIYVPADTYGDAESCHATILHYWIDILVEGGCSNW
jgi:D-sedoheptulose 7-phosphate isomerase